MNPATDDRHAFLLRALRAMVEGILGGFEDYPASPYRADFLSGETKLLLSAEPLGFQFVRAEVIGVSLTPEEMAERLAAQAAEMLEDDGGEALR